MAMTKIFFGAWGAVSVGASECVNATLQTKMGVCEASDMTVDSNGTVWFTSTPHPNTGPDTCSKVWMCPADGQCVPIKGDLARPWGIAVNVSDGQAIVYVSELGTTGLAEPNVSPGVKKCTVVDQTLDCAQFGSWDEPHGLALDHEGNVLVTNSHILWASKQSPEKSPEKSRGVWRCSASADCGFVVDTDHWPENGDLERGVAADSHGKVYVVGNHHRSNGSITSPAERCYYGRCVNMGFEHVAGLAVGPDDYVYVRDIDDFHRCTPDGVFCMKSGCSEASGFPGGVMAIDQNGIVYSVMEVRDDHAGPPTYQLALRTFSFDQQTSFLQV